MPIEDSSVLRERVGLQAINIISLLMSTVLK